MAGSAVCDDGLVIDLSAMRAVHVNATARTARVQAGATWGEVDRATQVHGLATPGGEVSVTGVAGLTLGGGLGVMMRTHGLSCDNLRSVEIVTADGMVRTASREEHTDLFGFGGGCCYFTKMPDRWCAPTARPRPGCAGDGVPELVLWSIPPDPEIPAELHGQPVAMVGGLYAGDPADASAALAPLAGLGTPLMDLSATVTIPDAQSAPDPLFPGGSRYFFKSHFPDDLSEEAIEALATSFDRLQPPDADRHANPRRRDRPGSPTRAPTPPRPPVQPELRCGVDRRDDARRPSAGPGTFTAIGEFAAGGVYTNFAGFEDEADVSRPTAGLGDASTRSRRPTTPTACSPAPPTT